MQKHRYISSINRSWVQRRNHYNLIFYKALQFIKYVHKPSFFLLVKFKLSRDTQWSQRALLWITDGSVTDGEVNGSPLQYSCLENPMDRGAWWAAVHGVAMSRTWLSDFTLTFHFHALEKEVAAHSSVLARRIPVTAEPGGLPSMGSHRVRHDCSDLAAAAA